jgi:hypothetical protein
MAPLFALSLQQTWLVEQQRIDPSGQLMSACCEVHDPPPEPEPEPEPLEPLPPPELLPVSAPAGGAGTSIDVPVAPVHVPPEHVALTTVPF